MRRIHERADRLAPGPRRARTNAPITSRPHPERRQSLCLCEGSEEHVAFVGKLREAKTLFEDGGARGDGGRAGVIQSYEAMLAVLDPILADNGALEPLRYTLECLKRLNDGVAHKIHHPAIIGCKRGPDPAEPREFKTAFVLYVECLTGLVGRDAAYARAKEMALPAAAHLGIALPHNLDGWRRRMPEDEWLTPGPILAQRGRLMAACVYASRGEDETAEVAAACRSVLAVTHYSHLKTRKADYESRQRRAARRYKTQARLKNA
jgi:hypothetical protein